MTTAPPLEEGETVVFDHIPNLRAFKRSAVLMIGLTLPVVVVFLVVFPDTFWPAVPLFVTCLLLMQERFSLGRYRAWITNRRILLQGGESLPLTDVSGVTARGNGVRVRVANGGKAIKLVYAESGLSLIDAINTAKANS